MKWTLTVDNDGILTFPPDLLEMTGWKEGDVILWTDNGDGSWSLTKKMLQFTMNEKIQEALDILQEECGEVIVEISKCRRFGFDSPHYKTGVKHSAMLEAEIGDVLAMIDILIDRGVIDPATLELAKANKIEKLKKWSKIYE